MPGQLVFCEPGKLKFRDVMFQQSAPAGIQAKHLDAHAFITKNLLQPEIPVPDDIKHQLKLMKSPESATMGPPHLQARVTILCEVPYLDDWIERAKNNKLLELFFNHRREYRADATGFLDFYFDVSINKMEWCMSRCFKPDGGYPPGEAGIGATTAAGRIDDGLEVTWGDGRGSVSPDGQVLTLSLDHTSGSGFRSRDTYLFARADMQIKLVPNNSAGTVTTCYFISEGPWDVHDEVDLEFLGNVSGQPYTLHTNVFANGNGGKEQQFHLWFDPTADFHTYSIEWTQQHILVLVDGTPIREFKNHADAGVPYPSSQRMRLYGSLWDAEDWATQGGRVKTDWSQAPFAAQYRNFTAADASPSSATAANGYGQQLDAAAQQAMKWARDNYMVYDYCADTQRFPQGVPPDSAPPAAEPGAMTSAARAHLLASLPLALTMMASVSSVAAGGRMTDQVDILWGPTQLINESNGDQTLGLSLDRVMGSGFRSKRSYLFARIDIDIKLVAGNSAGTVTTVYLMSEKQWKTHDEIDLEFLGNVTGQPYTLHTNIFANGSGGREVQYRLWFDPTLDFHTYSIIWNSDQILILVDNMAIRRFKNHWDAGVPFPVYQPMRFNGVLWDADDWATQGGRVKTDWTQAPFTAYFRNYRANGCEPSGVAWVCGQDPSGGDWFDGGAGLLLDDVKQQQQLREAQDRFMIYNYCTDSSRFPDGVFPKECGLP
ncbi:Xyloglucan endotransglucosylase/hydrolase protein 24 [Dichanthelium oligosanthes]|uniref:xyloglucan:xyloglucosyl transferase n=1 Tax=Dichanthelium oligosanthes TaxID=888268 RepID=A0A1E5W602_9POAL|nr:Xyloglucan endotransglucosylase/hydrolase protein 24 [Dichanthelium oligosanthes]